MKGITFKSFNFDGSIRDWKFDSVEALKQKWNDDFEDLPANDDSIVEVYIDGKGTLFKVFEDLLTYIGIDVWGI